MTFSRNNIVYVNIIVNNSCKKSQLSIDNIYLYKRILNKKDVSYLINFDCF